MSPPSSEPRGHGAARTWSGPALLLLGIGVLVVLLLPNAAGGSLLAAWLRDEMLAPSRVLPLIGLGVAFAFARRPARLIAILLGAVGIAAGFWLYKPLTEPLWIVPRAIESRFLTGPLLDIAAGIALVVGARWRTWLLAPLTFVAGIALALGIVVTDPSIKDATFAVVGVLLSLWLVTSAALCASMFRASWLNIGGRIFGSWLVAIGLLYGASAFVRRPIVVEPPPAPGGLQNREPLPPGAPQPMPLPPGEPLPQPDNGGMLPQ